MALEKLEFAVPDFTSSQERGAKPRRNVRQGFRQHRVSAITGMKFVSPFHRRNHVDVQMVQDAAPATFPKFIPMLKPSVSSLWSALPNSGASVSSNHRNRRP